MARDTPIVPQYFKREKGEEPHTPTPQRFFLRAIRKKVAFASLTKSKILMEKANSYQEDP